MVNHGDEFKDRRKHPRVGGNIPVKICGDEYDAVTETKNLSRSGVSCRVNKYIEPMTKLKIQLLLSFKKKEKKVTKKVACQGVVVRVEPISSEGYFHTAIYFNDISDKDAVVISDYVHVMLDKEEKE